MATRTRKLLLLPEHEPYIANSPGSHSGISSNTLSAQNKHRDKSNGDYYISNGSVTSSGYGGFGGYRLNEPFDTSMVLTVLVLLTAIFFMGFFSMYMRRVGGGGDDPVDDPSRFRRRRPASLPSYRSASAKGADPDTVDSLPVYSYSGTAKQGIKDESLECAICLSEFEEGEGVKVIPFCGHVFHVGCIEMWLESHVTCPLCRTAKLLPEKTEEERGNAMAPAVEEVRVGIGCDAGEGQQVEGLGSTVDGRDTWSNEGECVVGPGRLRRCGSCSWLSERAVLRRSLSF